ncbi:MAG: glycosyltransferase [Nitrospirae bacterium]|nr:glycosyltransferase [Nitrospirota bacterium]
MPDLPKATISIPAYNAEATISDTLESILGQTYPNMEIIVSDNHSTDRTCEIVRSYKDRGVRLVTCPVVYQPTGSPLDNTNASIGNWNSLVDLGSGDLMTIYHADDIYEKDIVASEVNFFLEHPECSAVFTGCTLIDETGKFTSHDPVRLPRALAGRNMFEFRAVLNGLMRDGLMLVAPSIMLRRGAWKTAGGLDIRFEQAVDTEMWLRLAKEGPIGIIDRPLVRRRIHRRSDSYRGRVAYRHATLPFINVFQACLADPSVVPLVDDCTMERYRFYRAGEHARVAINFLADGNLDKWKEHLAESQDISMKGYARHTRRAAAWIFAARCLALLGVPGLGMPVARRFFGNSIK